MMPVAEAQMQKSRPGLADVLDRLETHYGEQAAVGPSDPYEMILFVNCGYPATDASCTKGYEALKREVGTKPGKILAAPKAEGYYPRIGFEAHRSAWILAARKEV